MSSDRFDPMLGVQLRKLGSDLEERVAALVEQAFTRGRQYERSRIRHVLDTNAPDILVNDETGGTITMVEVKPARPPAENAVWATLYAHAKQGIFRKQIAPYCEQILHQRISEIGVLTILRDLQERGLAQYQKAKHVWGPTKKLIEEFDGEIVEPAGKIYSERASPALVKEAAE